MNILIYSHELIRYNLLGSGNFEFLQAFNQAMHSNTRVNLFFSLESFLSIEFVYFMLKRILRIEFNTIQTTSIIVVSLMNI